MSDFGDWLKDWRSRKGWSQAYVIRRGKIPKGTIAQWESGKNIPSGYIQEALKCWLNDWE